MDDLMFTEAVKFKKARIARKVKDVRKKDEKWKLLINSILPDTADSESIKEIALSFGFNDKAYKVIKAAAKIISDRKQMEARSNLLLIDTADSQTIKEIAMAIVAGFDSRRTVPEIITEHKNTKERGKCPAASEEATAIQAVNEMLEDKIHLKELEVARMERVIVRLKSLLRPNPHL